MTIDDETTLADAARALVDAIREGREPRVVLAAVTQTLACAACVEGTPPRRTPPSVPPVTWSLAGSDPLRRAAHGVYRTDASVELRVRELHALVAPYVLAGETRALAWDLAHAWGDVATSLVRPLWELAHG